MERAEIETKVTAIVADVLGLETDEVTPESRFFQDLGGESIDILDTTFQIQKTFGVNVDFNAVMAGDAIATNDAGVVTAESLEKLHAAHPFLPIDRLPENPTPETLKELLTVGVIAKLVEEALAVREAQVPDA